MNAIYSHNPFQTSCFSSLTFSCTSSFGKTRVNFAQFFSVELWSVRHVRSIMSSLSTYCKNKRKSHETISCKSSNFIRNVKKYLCFIPFIFYKMVFNWLWHHSSSQSADRKCGGMLRVYLYKFAKVKLVKY